MPVFLEIARAACLSLARRLGLWMLGLALLAGVGWFADSEVTRVFLAIGMLGLFGAALPVVVGTGLRRWVRAGPLGLSDRGAGYWAIAGYGLGAALVALPFVAGAVQALDGQMVVQDQMLGAFGLLTVAWLGASAGRVAEGGMAVAVLTWIGAAVAGVCALIAASAGHDVAVGPLGAMIGYSAAEVLLWVGGAVLGTQLCMVGAAFADQRSPTRREW